MAKLHERSPGGEFALITRHFRRAGSTAPANIALGIGDDCALITPNPGHQLAISSDMLVEGRHFFPGAEPSSLGHKALAVNLSDLAAMGARPLGFTLALALPRVDDPWLSAFASGLFALADEHACPLVGGDTTRGPLNLCITVFGELLPGQALRRDAAQPGDDLYLSGRTGEARLALERLRGTPWAQANTSPRDEGPLQQRLHRPTPRVPLGRSLAGLAHAAIDISDGLASDLLHILAASGVGAELERAALPLAQSLAELAPQHQLDCLLHGGDDYELLFTAAPAARQAILDQAHTSDTPVQRIGRITASPGLHLFGASGQRESIVAQGWDHFG